MVILTVSCAKESKKLDAPAEFGKYVTAFEVAAAENKRSVSIYPLKISLADLNESGWMGIRGVCKIENSTRTLVVNINFWNSASDAEKEMHIFHELGHCVLGRGHDEWSPIMNSALGLGPDQYSAQRDLYLAELFKP